MTVVMPGMPAPGGSALPEFARPDPTERDSVDRWRIASLVAAGYPEEEALLLALDPDVDLHVAVGLLAHGCPLAVALRILF